MRKVIEVILWLLRLVTQALWAVRWLFVKGGKWIVLGTGILSFVLALSFLGHNPFYAVRTFGLARYVGYPPGGSVVMAVCFVIIGLFLVQHYRWLRRRERRRNIP